MAWLHTLLATLLKYREVVRLGKLAEELLEASRQMKALRDLLIDRKRAAALVVTRAERLPRLETLKLLDALGSLRMPASWSTPCRRAAAALPRRGARASA